MKTKKGKPILVTSTEQSSLIGQYKDTGKLVYNDHKSDIDRGIPMELVIISLDPDEKIEIGDLHYYENEIKETTKETIEYINNSGDSNFKKVIAIQSQLSPEYIQQFIKEYNQDNVKDIEIEMEEIVNCTENSYRINLPIEDKEMTFCDKCIRSFRLKLTNGFITIVNSESYLNWWMDNHPKSRYEMIQYFYPNYTGPITIEMIINIKSKIGY